MKGDQSYLTVNEYRAQLEGTPARPRKYRNVPTVFDGKRFDSQAEVRRYQELRLLEQAGHIRDLVCRPKFAFASGVRYEGDFGYTELPSCRWVVEDVKGVETAVFRLKARLMAHEYPLYELRVVKA